MENRHPETGEYPDFPDNSDGGSKIILNPPPPTLESILKDEVDDKKGGKGAKGSKPAKDTKPGKDKKGKGQGGVPASIVGISCRVCAFVVPAL